MTWWLRPPSQQVRRRSTKTGEPLQSQVPQEAGLPYNRWPQHSYTVKRVPHGETGTPWNRCVFLSLPAIHQVLDLLPKQERKYSVWLWCRRERVGGGSEATQIGVKTSKEGERKGRGGGAGGSRRLPYRYHWSNVVKSSCSSFRNSTSSLHSSKLWTRIFVDIVPALWA